MIKLYTIGNSFFIEKGDKKYNNFKTDVKFDNNIVGTDKYNVLIKDKIVPELSGQRWSNFTNNGTPFASQAAFKIFVYENTGFNTASGGSGAGGEIYNPYGTIALMLADQENQTDQQIIKVTDASADPSITFPSGETRRQAYYRYLGTTAGTMADYELISAPYGNHTGGGNSIPESKTGTTIEFTENALYNEITYLASGNLTLDLTDAVKGSVVVVYCDGYVPTISGETYFISGGVLNATKLNILSFFYDGTTIYLNIGNVNSLLAPSLSLTAGYEEIVVDWVAIPNADNYIVQRDTDSGFGTAVEIYNGALLTFTDTGLTNDTTYYYRVKAEGSGYLASGWSDTESETAGADATLLLHLDASVDASITTANSTVTQWADLTAYGNNLTGSGNIPVHSSANDEVVFTSDKLSRAISALNFQQADDFTILVLGLRMTSPGSFIENKLAGANGGWAITFSGDTTNLFFQLRSASTQNQATYNRPAGWNDDTPRNFIFQKEGSNVRIYDATNTNVGTNGSTSLGAIDYSGVSLLLGTNSTNTQPITAAVKVIKVWNRALDSTERDTELGL